MEKSNRLKLRRDKVLYTLIVAVLLFSLLFLVIYYTYENARKNGFEKLHVQTKEKKEDINLQILSDRENLTTMANFASKLYTDGEDLELVVKSFKSIGLIENVGILMPDNTFLTKVGTVPAPKGLDFKTEAIRGQYLSGILSDAVDPTRKVVRSVVPIKVDNDTVAMLYGVMNLDAMENRFMGETTADKAQLFIVERGNGNFIINTVSDELGNFSLLETRKFLYDYSYDDLRESVLSGESGYSAFVSKITGHTFYLHYAALEVGDWQIMLAEPETAVFAEARAIGQNMALMFAGIVLIMSMYIVLMFTGERKETKRHLCSSKVRKLLLGINKNSASINEALENIARFNLAHSSFYVDTDGEEYNYTSPSALVLSYEDKAYFISRLLNYIEKKNKDNSLSVVISRIVTESSIRYDEPEFYEFLKNNSIENVIFSGIINKNNHISLLGIINPRSNAEARTLLADISICFSMAIYNKKYLNKTEIIAATDPLTGLSNRMAYKKDIAHFEEQQCEDFSCVYIDVNELHVINNKYGHAAGDGMLLFIANALREVFEESNIYRIGGDEFLVFTQDTEKTEIENSIEVLKRKVEEMNYHISIGMDFCKKNIDAESLVLQAEKRMYEDKARYYQQKEQNAQSEDEDVNVESMV
ncbi:MAG: GGDEF domain-containing protein, partial [Clostridia bacterium]|nr:GGDEF domain-containing protein [Clostridia bacterium]